MVIMSMYMETERHNQRHLHRGKNNYNYVQPQRDRQTKKREIQLPWLPFCSCHWLPRYLLAPLALSSVVFSSFLLFLLPFPTQCTGYLDVRTVRELNILSMHRIFLFFISLLLSLSLSILNHTSLLLFSCPYLQLFIVLYSFYNMFCFSVAHL